MPFPLTIFLGAFLLFQVQPLIGKYILPWFGGGPGVWTTCMLFFQVLLLAGYAYAHLVTKYLRPRKQIILHTTLVIVAVAMLPIVPSDSWKPHGTENPTLYILLILTVALGLPYFVLSTTGPLIQHWFLLSNPGRSPYRLYALSNGGSLLALMSYPFYFETHFTRRTQSTLWSLGLFAYALSLAFCLKKLWTVSRLQVSTDTQHAPRTSSDSQYALRNTPSINSQPSTINHFLWLALPACASILLLATTNKICQDVAVIPFLWILPLALYLLSFIVCFDSPRWYVRFPYVLLLFGAFFALWWALNNGTDASILKQLSAYCLGLFICAMVCHGEVYRLRPAPEHLTAFYLSIAAGGALGGIFVGCIAPFIFKDFYELQCGLLLCAVLTFISWSLDPFTALWRRNPFQSSKFEVQSSTVDAQAVLDPVSSHSFVPRPAPLVPLFVSGLLLAVVIALAASFWSQVRDENDEKVRVARNFYGVLTVFEHRCKDPNEHHFLLQHGRITHGLQFVDAEEAAWPTTYYGEDSGVGLAVRALPEKNRRIGLVGLGTGTMASYGKAGDYLRIYEINPVVNDIASSNFSYISNSPARVEIAIGDARLSMEREQPEHFDLLVLDAFSGDAIPVHLLTKEAFQIYERHLNSNAIVAVHISNHYLDLEPVVANLAQTFGYNSAMIDYDETEDEWWLYGSTWILLTKSPTLLNAPAIQNVSVPIKPKRSVPLWTDDFTSVYQILKR